MATIDALRDLIYERDRGLCGICGEPVAREDMHMDHISARSRGGPDAVSNLRTAHALCNARRGDGHKIIETVGYALRLPPALMAKLKRWAELDHRSLNAQIVHLLERDVAEAERSGELSEHH